MTCTAVLPVNEQDKRTLEQLQKKLQRREITGVSIDSRTVKERELFVAIRGDRFDGHDFVTDALQKGAWGAVVASTFRAASGLRNVVPVEDTLVSLQELSLMHRRMFGIPIVGITGSNGKTTTKEMLACILQQLGPVLKNEGNLNNHIGVPLTLLRLNHGHRSAVIEMGMSGPGEIATLARLAAPTVGLITNIGPAHLQFLGTLNAVARAKGELLQGMDPEGTAVLNADDRYFGELRSLFPGRTVSFGVGEGADVRGTDIVLHRDGAEVTVRALGQVLPVKLRTIGRHNVSNALAAAAAAHVLGTPPDALHAGLEAFRPVSLRSEVREVKGRTVLADCYNANPGSMRPALETLSSLGGGRTVAVLGDMLELGDASADAHREIGREAALLSIDVLLCVGPSGTWTAEGARSAGMASGQVFLADTPSRAAAMLRDITRPGDAVLIKGSRGMKMEAILEEF